MTCTQQPDIGHNTTLTGWPDVRENGRPNDVEKRHNPYNYWVNLAHTASEDHYSAAEYIRVLLTEPE